MFLKLSANCTAGGGIQMVSYAPAGHTSAINDYWIYVWPGIMGNDPSDSTKVTVISTICVTGGGKVKVMNAYISPTNFGAQCNT